LNGIGAAKEWAADVDQPADEPSRYVAAIQRNILTVTTQLTEIEDLGHDVIGRWVTKLAKRLLFCCLTEFRRIESLSGYGRRLLATDITALQGVFSDWISDVSDHIESILEQLNSGWQARSPSDISPISDLRIRLNSLLELLQRETPVVTSCTK
jgi:hypothetical protein